MNIVYPSECLRNKMDNAREGEDPDDGNIQFWELVWEIATASTSESLHGLARDIENLVFPIFVQTRKTMDLIKRLAMQDNESFNVAEKPKTELIEENEAKQEGMMQQENEQKDENWNKVAEGGLMQENGVRQVHFEKDKGFAKCPVCSCRLIVRRQGMGRRMSI